MTPSNLQECFDFVRNAVIDLLPPETDSTLRYHNIAHTLAVQKDVNELALLSNVTDELRIVLNIVALLHDIGHLVADEGHEIESARMAQEILANCALDISTEELITQLILSTDPTRGPLTLTESLIRDADLLYVGKTSFIDSAEKLRQEWLLRRDWNYTDLEWAQSNLNFLTKHTFYSPIANENYQAGKHRNIELLHSVIEQLRKTTGDF